MAVDLAPWHVRWTNFRGYKSSPMIELPGLTLLIGRNNVGKTSVYAPLLLLRQTLDAKNADTALLLRGDLMDFGNYEDIVTDHEAAAQIAFYLDLAAPPVHAPPASVERAKPQALEVTFAHSEEHPARLVRSIAFDSRDRPIVTRSILANGSFRVSSPLLPSRKQIGRPPRELTELRRAIQSEKPEGFLFSGFAGLRLPDSYRQDRDRWARVQDWYKAMSDLYEVYLYLNHYITRALTRISYIGPLRSSPRRSYLVSAEPPLDVGRDGEFAAEVLYQSGIGQNAEVLGAANSWLERLGYGNLNFVAHGDYFQVFVRKSGENIDINIADCGMGLSQLLPLLVQGCVMRPGDTLIAQQPEIHLNPAQQDIMTDFLMSLVEAGRRVIVETHSEHILGRMRRRVAEGDTLDADDIAIYFCESANQRSSLRRIPMGGLGDISHRDWPTGFFNEQLENSMELALAQSRRRRESDA
jgi:AAA ATPase domain/Protein of unknown function (DUF3696)